MTYIISPVQCNLSILTLPPSLPVHDHSIKCRNDISALSVGAILHSSPGHALSAGTAHFGSTNSQSGVNASMLHAQVCFFIPFIILSISLSTLPPPCLLNLPQPLLFLLRLLVLHFSLLVLRHHHLLLISFSSLFLYFNLLFIAFCLLSFRSDTNECLCTYAPIFSNMVCV